MACFEVMLAAAAVSAAVILFSQQYNRMYRISAAACDYTVVLCPALDAGKQYNRTSSFGGGDCTIMSEETAGWVFACLT
eukprot:SAG31_NODE_531_length_14413_cov_7.712659_6_plen_79_part_00